MNDSKGPFTVGQLAKLAGAGVPTIRFYERRGLLPSPDRNGAGYRQYPRDHVRRVNFIRQAQQLGFSLREVQELLSLSNNPRKSCRHVRQRAAEKVSDSESKIANLKRMRAALMRLIDECPAEGPTRGCPILMALER